MAEPAAGSASAAGASGTTGAPLNPAEVFKDHAVSSCCSESYAGTSNHFLDAITQRLKTELGRLRVAELMAMLRDSVSFYDGPRLSTTGRKAQLVDRLFGVAELYASNRQVPANVVKYKRFKDILASKQNLVNVG